jgi:predicted enzyme related to lactoylglutathione lyase
LSVNRHRTPNRRHLTLEDECIDANGATDPIVLKGARNAPVNALGYLRVMFAVDDVDDTVERLRRRGAQLVGEIVRYKNAYRLCYIRAPEGLLGLAQELS